MTPLHVLNWEASMQWCGTVDGTHAHALQQRPTMRCSRFIAGSHQQTKRPKLHNIQSSMGVLAQQQHALARPAVADAPLSVQAGHGTAQKRLTLPLVSSTKGGGACLLQQGPHARAALADAPPDVHLGRLVAREGGNQAVRRQRPGRRQLRPLVAEVEVGGLALAAKEQHAGRDALPCSTFTSKNCSIQLIISNIRRFNAQLLIPALIAKDAVSRLAPAALPQGLAI